MNLKYIFIALFICSSLQAQLPTFVESDLQINEFVEGTLLNPIHTESKALAIIIGDYGPTDRNGNQNFQKNNNLKKIAFGLVDHNIATFRYDKRIVKQIRKGKVDKNMSFNDFVTDATSVIDYFKKKDTYKSIYIIGHSQGSLVGMLAAKDQLAGFISLAGSAKSIDQVILDQIQLTVPGLVDDAKAVFAVLKEGKTTKKYPPALSNMFNIETQPFISSWMQYNPEDIIKTLNIPVLIINGTKDLQVPVTEATQLLEASQQGKLEIIENMNHVLFTIEGDDLENSKSYNESFRPLTPELIEAIVSFIKS